MYGKGLRTLSIATAVTLIGAFALAFFYAPMDADQGISQKIFYVHVPMAIVALCGFVAGGVFAIQHLRSGDRRHDMRSYVAIHLALILGVGTLVTGSIWARASWGHWWVWDEPTLVSGLATQTRSRDLLGPLLGLPLLLPVIIGAARATTPLFEAAGAGALPGRWMAVLGLYDLVFGLIAYAVFDFLLED